MAAFLITALHDGSWWLILACLSVFVGTVAGLYTCRGSEIGWPIALECLSCGGSRITAENRGWGWKRGDQFG